MQIQKIYIGSWFQRTMLHLSEIYDFLATAESPLTDLSKERLVELRNALEVEHLEMHVGPLDHIHVHAKNGIHFRVYEDGLVTLSKDPTGDLKEDIDFLKKYYEEKLSPSFEYIFSLGAPVPKELANIETVYPYFIMVNKANEQDVNKMLNEARQSQYFKIVRDQYQIYRGNTLYVINTVDVPLEDVADFIQEQIFLREFKGQMHRYLNLHRIIWERIAHVKERGEIKGTEIKGFKQKIEGYNKSINMIESRINQMGVYVKTRGRVVYENKGIQPFMDVLEFKHEKLEDTLSYIKDIWKMTKSYVESAITLFGDLQAKATEKSIKSLTVVTSLGVAGTLMRFLGQDHIPVTLFGVFYLIVFVFIMYYAGKLFVSFNEHKIYKIKDVKADIEIE